MRVNSCRAFIALALLTFCGAVLAHRYHVAISHIERNEQGAIEVEHRLFMHDLEPLLLRLSKDKINFDSGDGEAAIRRYVESHFSLNDADGRAITLQWVGVEIDQTYAIIYQEAANVPSLKTLRYRNSLMTEISSQVNTLNLNDGAESASLVFQSGKEQAAWPSNH